VTAISGSVALVTGAGSGIGRSIACALAARGASLVLADLVEDRLDRVAAEIRQSGAAVATAVCDAADESFASRLAAAAEPFGTVDILVNNVGVLIGGHIEDIPPDEWLRVFKINVMSMVSAIHKFLPGMIERRSGHVVNTASFSGLYPYAYDRLPYAASKGAIVTLSQGLALYLKPQGIGVTLLCPGPVGTNIGETARNYTAGVTRRPPPFPMLHAATVGEQVAVAIAQDRFFLPTDPHVQPLMVELAEDVDGFIDRQIAAFAKADRVAAQTP